MPQCSWVQWPGDKGQKSKREFLGESLNEGPHLEHLARGEREREVSSLVRTLRVFLPLEIGTSVNEIG